MDGVAGLSQKNIEPGETYKYEFQLRQHGTYMYHSHSDDMTQMGLGMMGMFIIHPRNPAGPKADRDFALMLSEWRIDVGTMRPNPIEMTDFNVLTFNGRVFPGTAPLVAKFGDRVRIRFGNLSAMDHHPIFMGSIGKSLKRTVDQFQSQHGGLRRRSWSLSVKPEPWNSLRTIPAIGRCTAI